MLITFTGLFKTFILLVLAIATIVRQFWPRDADGNLVDPKELEKQLSRFPRPKMTPFLLTRSVLVLTAITILAAVFSR